MDAAKLKSRARAYKGHRYLEIPLPRTWPEAKSFCEKLGGHLATFADQAALYVPSLRWNAWIGLHQGFSGADGHAGEARWVTGEPLTFSAQESAPPEGRKGFFLLCKGWPSANRCWQFEPEETNSKQWFIIEWDD